MSFVGQVGVKIAGRDAGQVGVVVADLDKGYVEFANVLRSKKCNLSHIAFLNKKVTVKKGASAKDVAAALTKAGFTVAAPAKKKAKKAKKAKPKKVRKARDKTADKKVVKKAVKKKKKAAKK